MLKIISGGQTGVDRAALDAAIECRLACGGYCPKDRRAEDGPISKDYPLTETDSYDYQHRTIKNVQLADATLIIGSLTQSSGTALTIATATAQKRPILKIELELSETQTIDIEAIQRWITENKIEILNIAGPRESEQPGIYHQAYRLLKKVFLNFQNG